MIIERKKILKHRIVWSVITLLFIIIPLICLLITSNIEITDSSCHTSYYSSLDETGCNVDITFNFPVSSGNIEINFYDKNGNLLETKTDYFYGYSNNIWTYITVNGNVYSYEIVNYSAKPLNHAFYAYLFLPFPIVFLICSLLLCYKKYNLDGNEIIVYAGFYHHYIKINGEKYDEHNTITSFTPISLSCNFNDNLIQSTISLTNRISTKINGKLANSVK